MKKIVITGGTFAGKTTLTNEFQSMGYTVVKDTGLEIIEKLNEKIGTKEQKLLRTNNPAKFYSLIADRQLELEDEAEVSKSKYIFYDRGILDYIGFCKLVGIDIPDKIFNIADKLRYDEVFVCDTLSGFSERKDTGRSIDKNASIKVRKIIKEVYEEHGYRPINLKEMSIKERVDFVLEHIQF